MDFACEFDGHEIRENVAERILIHQARPIDLLSAGTSLGYNQK